MTVSLPSLLFQVRSSVAEISPEMMDDLTMYRELQKAYKYVLQIKKTGVEDADLETPIVCLAAYYSHVTYTLLNVRNFTIDESVLYRQNELRKIARALLLTITNIPLDSNLAVDESQFAKIGGLAFATTNGVLNDVSIYTWEEFL